MSIEIVTGNVGGGSGVGGFKLGGSPNIFDAGVQDEAAARALLATQQSNSTWLEVYQSDFEDENPSSVLILYTDSGTPKAKYLQWTGPIQQWRELFTVIGLRGLKGDKGDINQVTGGAFLGDDLVLENIDGSTAIIPNAKIDLKGERGPAITSVAVDGLDFVFTDSLGNLSRLLGGVTTLKGDRGLSFEKAEFIGDDAVFTYEDDTTVVIVDAKLTLKGEKGDKADNVIYQFSINSSGPWVSAETFTLNPDIYFYWRWSVDNGITWSPNGIRFQSSLASLPNGYEWVENGEGLILKKGTTPFIELDGEETYVKRLTVTNHIFKFGTSKAVFDVSENILFKNTITDRVFHPVWQNASSDDWGANVRRPLDSFVKQNFLTTGYVGPDTNISVEGSLQISAQYNLRVFSFWFSSPERYTDVEFVIAQGGKVKVINTLPVVDVGENHFTFPLLRDGLPFVDLLKDQVFDLTLRKSNGDLIQLHSLADDPTKPFWAIDFTRFEDVAVVDGRSAGEGFTFDEETGKFNLKTASNTVKGGVKIGSGLAITPDGIIYSTVSGSIVVVRQDLVGRLGLPQVAQAYTCIQVDAKRVFYLNPNEDPSDAQNWIEGPSTESAVSGFKGAKDSDPRTGVIEAEYGDYTGDMIPLTDKTTGKVYTLIVDNGVPYLEEK